jgi:hypothetical protein
MRKRRGEDDEGRRQTRYRRGSRKTSKCSRPRLPESEEEVEVGHDVDAGVRSAKRSVEQDVVVRLLLINRAAILMGGTMAR